jgi:CRISPR-associated protein Csx10
MSQALEVRLKGGLLLGGSAGGGLADATLRDSDGLPYIPASALKGAIREQLARLVSAERVREILGGPGIGLPAENRLQPMTERLGGGSTRVFFSDATLVDEGPRKWFGDGLGYARKTQVSIDRRSGRSADQRLFEREILAPFADGLRFRAEVDLSLLGAEARGELAAAVAAVFALGGGRTSGLGGVEMRLIEAPRPAPEECEIEEIADVECVLEALDPLCLGGNRLFGNFRTSLGHLPASVVRGAIVTAALRSRGQAHEDRSREPWFERLVLDPETCLRFGDALPIRRSHAMVPPFSTWTCKVGDQDHGVVDTLIRAYLQTLFDAHGLRGVPEESCPTCGARLVPAGTPLGGVDPERRVVTRLGIDAASGRGADGQLFSVEVLERGTRFAARIGGLDGEGRKLLADAAGTVLRAGHGRGQGYGRLKIVDIRAAPSDDLHQRLERFNGWLRRSLDQLAKVLGVSPEDLGANRTHFAVTLTSDLVPADTHRAAEDALLADFSLDEVEILYGQVRTGQRGGWDALRGRPKPYCPTLRAGSCLLLRSPRPLAGLHDGLLRLETRGAGLAREEGLGWMRFSDPVHSPQWRKP